MLRLARWATAILYVLFTVLALRPALPRDLGLDVSGFAVEGALVVAFLFIGVNQAFGYFMHPPFDPLVGEPAPTASD